MTQGSERLNKISNIIIRDDFIRKNTEKNNTLLYTCMKKCFVNEWMNDTEIRKQCNLKIIKENSNKVIAWRQ